MCNEEKGKKMKYKYPRTYHLPFSLGYTSDDKVLENDNQFHKKEVVITEKMDGENTSIYKDYCHARSIDSSHKDYHSWLLNYIKNFQYLIPNEYRICGEYLYAKHSIKYTELDSYFLAFSVWDGNVCFSWDDTEKFCKSIGLKMVPVLYKGIYDKDKTLEIAEDMIEHGGEGIVVRNASSFIYDEFHNNIAKYVRKNHVQTDKHWSLKKMDKNELKK